ncbi:LtrA domain containing protein [Pyrenophora teres f. teres]|uniref:LtrA domain containing protein n=1 Tax=Pyrenophora teres f. teres TaxID=97479 RepID=A0A6S6VFQ3_9PLEO|nr:LtrA domain containing protein [Pyrenophora teres f. teres]
MLQYESSSPSHQNDTLRLPPPRRPLQEVPNLLRLPPSQPLAPRQTTPPQQRQHPRPRSQPPPTTTPTFHHHTEATTQELFFDLFFVANLTTFTSLKEINDAASLRAYTGFFALLWLTWYSNALYDVRFSSDSLFERMAKALHFGVMVGFAVVGPAWEPGRGGEGSGGKYRVLSFILMVSRGVLAAQYGVTLYFVRRYRGVVVPLGLVVASELVAAVLYGVVTAALPPGCEAAGGCGVFSTRIHVAWYVIGIAEVVVTVGISCYWRVISFKGTHIQQRMSLLTLIILGEGIIVICKAVSKLVKIGGEFDSRVTGQIVAAVVIIYLLYMLYFDRMHDDHFGTIKQQIWASLHFFLHIMLVLVLQGVSYLIMWVVALVRMDRLDARFRTIEAASVSFSYANGTVFADTLRKNIDAYLWNTVPKGVDASKALGVWNASLVSLAQGYDGVVGDRGNMSAVGLVRQSLNTAESVAIQTMFDSLGVSVPKDEAGYAMAKLDKAAAFDKMDLLGKYEKRFELVFDYAGLALTLMACIAFLSLQQEKRHLREYLRLLVMLVTGFTICLICLVGTNKKEQKMYMESAWMLPTICILFFLCVVARHIRRPKWMKRNKAE